MGAVVLESSLGSEYEDSPSSYEFPSQYLRYFAEAAAHPPVFAVLYEPRGDDARGRMKYVGLAEIAGPPTPTGRTSRSGRPLYVVHYREPAFVFDAPVPREVMGEPVETWLRQFERGRARNVATLGRAVRPLSDADFQRILEIAGAAIAGSREYPLAGDLRQPLPAVRERSRALVAILRRRAEFSREVIAAYGDHCSISGFALGRVPVTKALGLLDAAHIRPVSFDGPDDVSNGLPLTPTLHRLFDAGLFTITYADGRPVVRVSPRLETPMLASPDLVFRMPLRDGLQLRVPSEPSLWPHPDALRFHQTRVFKAT